jgi:hypothetical protein
MSLAGARRPNCIAGREKKFLRKNAISRKQVRIFARFRKEEAFAANYANYAKRRYVDKKKQKTEETRRRQEEAIPRATRCAKLHALPLSNRLVPRATRLAASHYAG